MTVTASIVPRLTRADLLAFHAWTAANERARESYHADPFAASRAEFGVALCYLCRDGRHGRCTSRAWYGLRLCACWLDEHGLEGGR